MKKKPKIKSRSGGRARVRDSAVLLKPLFSTLEDVFGALAFAAKLLRARADEVDAIERVRTFLQKRIAGVPAHVGIEDLLFAFGVLAYAVHASEFGDVEPGAERVQPMHLPSASELWDLTVPRHLHTAHRAASALTFATA